jgi:hypothetical protein
MGPLPRGHERERAKSSGGRSLRAWGVGLSECDGRPGAPEVGNLAALECLRDRLVRLLCERLVGRLRMVDERASHTRSSLAGYRGNPFGNPEAL